jgi:hypothetical protein
MRMDTKTIGLWFRDAEGGVRRRCFVLHVRELLTGSGSRLTEAMHNLLEISLAPSVPASLHNIPTKYNIIIRLWTPAFHKLLESLRRASFTSLLALEHLQDFIYYAYTFHTGLLEEQTIRTFRAR